MPPQARAHPPTWATLTPCCAASHGPAYVTPSHPHAATNASGQASGRSRQTPGAAQAPEAYAQYRPDAQSAFVSQDRHAPSLAGHATSCCATKRRTLRRPRP